MNRCHLSARRARAAPPPPDDARGQAPRRQRRRRRCPGGQVQRLPSGQARPSRSSTGDAAAASSASARKRGLAATEGHASDLGRVLWSFGSGSCSRHISLGAGAPPNGRDGGAASVAVIEELESFFAMHGGAIKTGSVAPAPHKEPSARSPPKWALSVTATLATNYR
jgi:hypothetical protein